MRIGITTQIEFSVFSCGSTNTCLALAELAKALGHEPTLLNLRGSEPWWQDCVALAKAFPVAHLEGMDLSGANPFDLVLEVGTYTLMAAQRAALAKRAVWVIRKPFVINETEASIYPITERPRELAGISQAWLLTEVTAPDDGPAVEIIAGVPTCHVPFVWSPMPAEAHARSFGAPTWSVDPSGGFVVHMVDTNTTSTSSSTIPLVIMRESARQGLPIYAWRLHNGEMIAKSRFFRENVLKHCSDMDLSGQCVGRQRCVEWTTHPGAIAIAHMRFTRLRPVLLDLAWAGIPVVHNSLALRDIGFGAERFFYADNSVREGVAALKTLVADALTGDGWFKSLEGRRERILQRWSPLSRAVQGVWGIAIEQVMKAPAPVAVAAPARLPAPVVKAGIETEPEEKVKEEPKATEAKPLAPAATQKTEFHVVFSDMWENFQTHYNFFTLLLNEAGKGLAQPVRVIGHSQEEWSADRGDPDLVIFGPFGSNWLRYGPAVPRVHYTGENSPAVQHPFVKLNLGHETFYLKNDYMRIPHWLISINWFGADADRLKNPRPIPLELATRTSEAMLEARKKFCAFVVSNPKNPVRNLAYKWVNSYKPVDSGGALYNTIGDELAAGLGGGGGEWKKVKFYQNYKFILAYENESNKGYCTEKFLHAKAAGCIPIYWGDPDAQRDFDLAGAIDARDCKTADELIARIRAVDEDDAEWRKRAAVPALDDYRVGLARRALSEMARRMLSLMGVGEDELGGLPRFLGAAPGSVAARTGMEHFAQVEAPAPAPAVSTPAAPTALEVPLMVTYATFKFLGSLQHWLKAVQAQAMVIPTLNALVFLGPDIPPESAEALKNMYPFVTFEPVPSDWTPLEFSDFWEPSHYAWKLWIYHQLSHRTDLSGQLLFYTDAGACLISRWPRAWLLKATQEGVCCLEDPREVNDRWCSDTFCKRLAVTDEERAARQITAGFMIWRAGDPRATAFFDEAFRLGCERDIIVGPRAAGIDTDGKAYGHRQDQSILSILVRRHGIPLHPLDEVCCDHSMRKTFTSGCSIYLHRGNYTQHIHPIKGVHDMFVINLDRREDRLARFYENHPGIQSRVNRYSAFDGRALALTPELAALFAPNDFFWKKSVMGCALSHLGLWWKLVNEHPDIENYLIFEDDAKMRPGWEEVVEKSMEHAPEDWDVLYLGGILPPNRSMYEQVLTPVTKYYSRIKPNTIFGQSQPTPYFHSCAYAYILSRRGALKIMNNLTQHAGYWTSADHIMCSSIDVMNLYFLTPSVAGCYQDDDPKYANSDFNNFSRVDEFDSDLWNNDERFSVAEIRAAQASAGSHPGTGALLKSIYGGKGQGLAPQPKAPVEMVDAETARIIPINVPTPPIILDNGRRAVGRRIVTFEEYPINIAKAYELNWLCELMGGVTQIAPEVLPADAPAPEDVPIVVFQRPYVAPISQILRRWSAAGARFKILHLSDEHPDPEHQDPLVAYELPGCIGVLRNYLRDDIPEAAQAKVITIPLGWRWAAAPQAPDAADIMKHLPSLPFREYHWSFFGTDWNGRGDALKPLTNSKLLGNYKFFGQWNDPTNLTREAYLDGMLNSIFVPCPDGVNPETFRFYEALQAGCIPLVVKSGANAAWLRWVTKHVPVMGLTSWEDALRVMVSLILKPETMEIYRGQLIKGWLEWVAELKSQVTRWLTSDE